MEYARSVDYEGTIAVLVFGHCLASEAGLKSNNGQTTAVMTSWDSNRAYDSNDAIYVDSVAAFQEGLSVMPRLSPTLWDLAITECCQEPVHIPGVIQPFGALVVTDLALETITHVSANLLDLWGGVPQASASDQLAEAENSDDSDQIWESADLLGRCLDTVLPGKLIHDLANVCGLPWISSQRERMGIYEINGRSLNVCVHTQGDRTLIELEPVLPIVERSQTLVNRLKFLLQGDQSTQTVLSQCAEELRHATGFDRVMVYQFLQDGAGEVVAEARANTIESLLNLRFPATDIPDLARQIFYKIALRPIPDLNASPVPLLSLDKAEAPLDLSLVCMRGASEVHTQEYLPNMGVAGSMTLAIIVENELWGLFAFHHRQPKLLSPEFRAIIELCGLLISLYLQQKQSEESFKYRQQAAKLLTQMFGQQVRTDNDWQTLVIQSLDQLCDLISANGLALVSDRQVLAAYGDVPENSTILMLIEETQAGGQENILTIDNLSQSAQAGKLAEPWGPSAGVLLLPIGFNGFNYLAFFRNETITEVNWAGAPDNQQIFEAKNLTGVQMRPQRSFEAYKQLAEGFCRPWSHQDRALAQSLCSALETQVFLQERQSLLIAELKHRVKNILALIRSVARQTSRSAQSIDQYIRVLEQRISSLAMAHEFVTRRELSWPRLQDLLELELRPYLNSLTASPVVLTGPDVTLNSSFVPTLILVIHEMVSNTVKYGALSVPDGKLTIRWFEDRGGLRLLWRETDGPVVHCPSADSRGFGCELIERAIPYEFEGEVSLCFAPSGVEANFWFPHKLVRWETPEPKFSELPETASSHDRELSATLPREVAKVANKAVLLVEDNMLIAIEMEKLLKKFGFSKIDSAPSVGRAMKLLSNTVNQYQICLLDINLKTETSFAIAYHLTQIQIPTAFMSGYDSKHPIPNDLKDIPLLKKPVDSGKLFTLIQNLLGET